MYDVSGLNSLFHLIMGLSPKRRTLQSSVRSAIDHFNEQPRFGNYSKFVHMKP